MLLITYSLRGVKLKNNSMLSSTTTRRVERGFHGVAGCTRIGKEQHNVFFVHDCMIRENPDHPRHPRSILWFWLRQVSGKDG